MAVVQTVLGPIAPGDMGPTSMHEHIIFGYPGWEYDPEALWRENLWNAPKVYERIYNDLVDFKAAGGRTFVDCSGIGLGRDVDLYVSLARDTGVHLVAATGFWAQQGIAPYFRQKDIDYLEELFVRELTVGMEHSRVKAGIIKVGNSGTAMTPLEEATYRAAARAAKKTGCAVTTHGVNFARRQVEVLLDEGLDPERAIIGHLDAAYSLDMARDKEFARRGFYIGYDHIGTENTWSPAPYAMPDEYRIQMIHEIIAAGFIDRLILSNDTNGQSTHRPTQLHPYRHLYLSFMPRLRRAGVTEEQIHTMIVENPRRALPLQ